MEASRIHFQSYYKNPLGDFHGFSIRQKKIDTLLKQPNQQCAAKVENW